MRFANASSIFLRYLQSVDDVDFLGVSNSEINNSEHTVDDGYKQSVTSNILVSTFWSRFLPKKFWKIEVEHLLIGR